MSRQTGVATQSVADVAAEDVQSSALERAAVREVAAEAVFLDQRVGPSAGDPRPPADGLHRSFAGVRAVVRIADPDAERAQTTLELLAHLASQLGISLDHLDIRVDAEADTRTRSRGAGGLMAEGTVYLAPRRYSPRTREGKYLLAHEVAHAAQRSSRASSHGAVAPRLQAELEAHAAGEAFAAGRLLDPVRTSLPRWYVAADVDADRAQLNTVMARQHRGELARMHDLLSYSLFDWAITDNDVDGVLTILAGFQMVAARSLVGALTPKDRDRLLDNLSTSHYKDFRTQVLTVFWGCEGPLLLKFQSVVRAGLETMDLKQLDPLEAVAVNYALQSVSEPVRNALLSGKKHEELQSIQSYAQDPSTQDEIRQKEGKEITDALDEERKREETRKEAQKIFESERGAKELAPLVKEIKQSLAGSGSHHSAALTALIRLTDYLGDPVALRAIAQNLSGGTGTPPDERVTYEEKDYLDELIRQTPVQSLYPDTDLRRVFFRLLTFRPAYRNEEWAADLSRAGFFDLWMNSEDAFLAFQLVKALPEPSRKAFYQRNGGGDWANILKKMSRSQLESESMNLYTGGEDDRDRNALLTALLRDETWESRDTSRLDGLIRMAIAAGEHEFVFTQSQQRQAYARAWLKPIVDKYMLYDPNGVDARGRKRDHYSHEILEGTSWYETGITGAITGFIGGAASTTAQSIDFAFRSRNTLSLIGSLFTKSVGGQGLNLVEFQDIFGGSFMGLTFQGFAKLGREGQEAKEHHKGVNFADARWDTGNGILTLNAEHLELASISYPAPQGKLQTGRGAAYGFNLNLQYGTSDKPKPAVIDLRIDRLELDDVLWISSNSMLSINIARVFNLLVNIGSSSTDFDSLARPDQGFKWNILGSLWRIFTLGSEGKEMSAALLKPQDVPLGVNVSIGSISLSGFTTSGGQYIESIEVQDLVLRGGGDIESYQKALAASQQRLQRRLDAARQALARAATPEDRERSQREVNQLERQLAHVMEESEAVGTARSEIAALEAKKKQQPLTPQESERLRRLKAQFAGAVLDVGKVALKGLAGLTKGTVELENVHGQGRSLAGALSLVSADFLAGMIAGEAGRPVIKGQDQQVFSLDVGRIDLPSITLVGSIPTEKKAREDLERFQAKLQPWRPSHQAELKRLQDRVTLAAQREALMRKPGITNLTPDQRAEFNGLEKQLQDLEQQAATTIGRITLEGAGIGVTASGTLDVSAEHLAINDVRAGQYHVRSIEGDKVRAGFDVSDGILGIADLRKNLTGVDVSAGGLTARGIENAEIGLTIDSATLLGLDEAQLARNEGNASARLVSRLVLVEGVRLKNLEAMLVAEKNYLQSRRTPGATLSPNEEARLATLSQKLAQLEALRSRVAQAETKRAKAKTEKQRQAVEAERAQAQQDLDRWAEGVIVGSLAVRDVDVEATGLGDVLSPDYDPSAALDRGIEITGRGGPSGSRMFSGATATDSSIPGLSGKKVTVGETSGKIGISAGGVRFENVRIASLVAEAFEWHDGTRRAYSTGASKILDIQVTASVGEKQIVIDDLEVGAILADHLGYEDRSTGLSVEAESGGLSGISVKGLTIDLPPGAGQEMKISKGSVRVKSIDELRFHLLMKGLRARGTLSGSLVSVDFVTDRKRIYSVDDLALRGAEITSGPDSKIHASLSKLRGKVTEETTESGDTTYTLDVGVGNLTAGKSRWVAGGKLLEIGGQAELRGISLSAEALFRKKGDNRELVHFTIRRLGVRQIDATDIHVVLSGQQPDPKKPGEKLAKSTDIQLDRGTIAGLEVTGLDLKADLGKMYGKVEVTKSLDLQKLRVALSENGKETLKTTLSVKAVGKEGGAAGVEGRELSATLLGPKGYRAQIGTIASVTGEVEGYGVKTAFAASGITMSPIEIAADGSRVAIADVSIKSVDLTGASYKDEAGTVVKLASGHATDVTLKQVEALFGEVTDADGKKSSGMTNLTVKGLTFPKIEAKGLDYTGTTTLSATDTKSTRVTADSVTLTNLQLDTLSRDFNARITKLDATLQKASATNFGLAFSSTLKGETKETRITADVTAGRMSADLTMTGTKVGGKDWTSIDGQFRLDEKLGLTNIKASHTETGTKAPVPSTIFNAAGIDLSGFTVRMAPNGTALVTFDDLTGKDMTIERGDLRVTIPFAQLKNLKAALQRLPSDEAIDVLGAHLDELKVTGVKVEYTIDRAAPPSKGAAAAKKWTLEALGGLSGTVRAHVEDLPWPINHADIDVPIRSGVINFDDFEGVTPTARPNIPFGVDPQGIYVDRPIIPRPFDREYKYKEANIPGATFEEVMIVPQGQGEVDEVIIHRGKLNLRTFLEAKLNAPPPSSSSGGSAPADLSGLNTVSIKSSTLQLGGGTVGTESGKVDLPSASAGKNQITIESFSLGRTITIGLPKFEASKGEFDVGGKKLTTGLINANVTVTVAGLANPSFKFTITLAVESGSVVNIAFGDVTLALDEKALRARPGPGTK